MEQLSKNDLFELAEPLEKKSDANHAIQQWPLELRSLYESFVKDDDEAEAFAQQLLLNQELDRLLAEIMADVPLPVDLADRIVVSLRQEIGATDVGELVQPKLAEVQDTSYVAARRRRSLQFISVMAVVIFGFALWPFFASDRIADYDVTQLQQSIDPWMIELDQRAAWNDVAGEVNSIVKTLQQYMPLGTKVRHATVDDGHLVLDFSSPRNGKIVIFVLDQNAIEVPEPQFEVLQVSGPFAAARGRIGNLHILIVTNESMKRIGTFLQGQI